VTPLEINHWLVGAGVLVIFLVLMLALLIFGAGREHS
jgi:Sec-independent protein translocase protein TatA